MSYCVISTWFWLYSSSSWYNLSEPRDCHFMKMVHCQVRLGIILILIESTINVIQILRQKYRWIFKYVSIKKYYSQTFSKITILKRFKSWIPALEIIRIFCDRFYNKQWIGLSLSCSEMIVVQKPVEQLFIKQAELNLQSSFLARFKKLCPRHGHFRCKFQLASSIEWLFF